MEQAPAAEGQAQAPEAQGQATTWYDKAPDEVKGYIQNKGWDDPIKAVQSYQELEKFRGASEKELIKLPKDFDAEGALDPIYDKLGRPEAPDKYSFAAPEGVQVDENRMKGAQELAHKIGLNQKQFEALAQFDAQYWQQIEQHVSEEQAKRQEADYQALLKDWGNNAPQREELARRGLRSVLPDGDKDGMVSAIEEAIGTAATLKLFANVGDKLSREDKIHDGGSTGQRFGYTREQALSDRKTLMAEIQADPKRLANYNNGVGPDLDKMKNLNKVIAS